MSLYFWILFGSGLVPLLLSFDRRLQFYRQWKYVFPSILVVAILYISFDVVFTNRGHWGFNERYISAIQLFRLPLEEVLFFVIIPYASIFLHEVIREYFPKLKVTPETNRILMLILTLACLALILVNLEQAYTSYAFAKMLIALIFAFLLKLDFLRSFYLTFLVIIVPFVLVNGILTGSFIPEEVVWYNNAETIGIRFFTIPVEDFAYAFSLILFNLITINFLKKIY